MRFERNVVFWVAALAVFVALLWLLSPILLPFVLGMAIAYVLDPLANQLSKRGVSRLLAAVLILGGFVVALALLVLLIAPVLAKQLSAFIDNVPVYALRLQAFVSDPTSHPWIKRIIGDNLTGADKSVGDLMNQTVGYLTGLLASLWAKGQALISIFSLLIITPVVAFYLICDWDRMVAALDRLVPVPQRETVRNLGREIDATIAAYVRGQSGVCLILGSYYATGLTFAGLSFGLLIGVISGLISFIPYVGSLTALILSLAVALAQFAPDWTRIVIVAGIVLFGQFLEGYVVAAEAGRRKRRIASGLADFRAIRVRLSFRLCRTLAGRAFGGRLGRAHRLCVGPLLRQSALYRQPAAIMSSGR
jgi:predicted PurR-regulated permease PerM